MSELLCPKKVEDIHPQQPLDRYVHTVFSHWIPIDHVLLHLPYKFRHLNPFTALQITPQMMTVICVKFDINFSMELLDTF